MHTDISFADEGPQGPMREFLLPMRDLRDR